MSSGQPPRRSPKFITSPSTPTSNALDGKPSSEEGSALVPIRPVFLSLATTHRAATHLSLVLHKKLERMREEDIVVGCALMFYRAEY